MSAKHSYEDLEKRIQELERKESASKLSKKKMQDSKNKLVQAVQGNSIPTFIIDHNHIITHWNNACENLTGFSRAQMVGTKQQWLPFYHEERPILADLIVDGATEKEITGYYEKKINESILVKGAYEGERLNHDLEEKEKWLFFSAAPLRDQDGTIIGAIETIQDITKRKQNEQELIRLYQDQKERIKELYCLNRVAESIKWLESLKDILHDTVQLIPPSMKYPEITRARIVFDGEEHVSEGFKESDWCLSAEFRVRDKRGIVEVYYIEKRSLEDEGPFLKQERDLLNSIAQMLEEAAEKEYIRNEKNQLEAKYRQAQKMESVGRLAGGVAHDYNNALTAIMGFTELAIMDTDPEGPLQDDLNQVLKAARRAQDITRQLLAFARKQTIAPIVLDLNKNIKSMLKMLRRLIGEDIDLTWLPGKAIGNVKMDPSQIDQILANLCVNARDAIKGVGKITIETCKVTLDKTFCDNHAGFVPGEFVLMAIRDNGCGMDKEILDNIFEPFFTTKAADKGTGLGLATAYGIVKQNKGFINVYSEPDKGTTIKIYLPRHNGKAVKIQRENMAEIPQGRGETILVVEDDLPTLKLARKILERLNYTVLIADTPKEAMGIAQEHTGEIHLIVTDVIMPEMNGLELSKQLKSFYPGLKCMFMSGYANTTIAHHCVLDEGMNFIQKPFSNIDLATIIRKVLDRE